jgi:glycosyltransferase involved in cell wall biosynthesis
MRIALLIYGSLDTISGGYLYDRRLVEFLEKSGDTVTILSIPWRNYVSHLLDNFSAELASRLEALQVDFLIQDELNHPSLYLLNRRLNRTYPIISLVHHLRTSEKHPGINRFFYRWVEQRYLRSVDGFIFNSQTTRRVVEEGMGVRGKPGVVAVPAGDRLQTPFDPGLHKARALAAGPLRLIFLGSVTPRKGLHDLLEALKKLPREAWELDVVGSLEAAPGYAAGMQRRSQQAGWSQQVRFLGGGTDAELVPLLTKAHALVLPSTYEGYGIAYLEGMGAGLPAVGTTAGAAHELITPGENGFLVAPGRPAELSEVLLELSINRARLVSMGLAARARYEAHPGWDDSMGLVRSYLSHLLTEFRV